VTGWQIVTCVAAFVTPWLCSVRASVKAAGFIGINTMGAGMIVMAVAISAARLHLLDRDAFLWLVLPAVALTLSGLLMFSMAAFTAGFFRGIKASKERQS
jgi:hypothetical protein